MELSWELKLVVDLLERDSFLVEDDSLYLEKQSARSFLDPALLLD